MREDVNQGYPQGNNPPYTKQMPEMSISNINPNKIMGLERGRKMSANTVFKFLSIMMKGSNTERTFILNGVIISRYTR